MSAPGRRSRRPQARKNAALTCLLAADDEELAVLDRAAGLLEQLLARP
jgi:hypothetical protein